MDFFSSIQLLLRVDQLIRHRHTGNAKELAEKLDVSRSQWFEIKKIMEQTCGCPIAYDRYARTYYYTKSGEFVFKFDNNS